VSTAGTAETAAELHERALAENESGRHATARRLLHRALRLDPAPERRAHILISLAYHEAERHSLESGIELLAQADAVPGLPRRLRGLVASQRGLLYLRAARMAEATAELTVALRLVDDSQPQDVCRALLNRGIAAMSLGRPAAAKDDLTRCAALARRTGLDLLAAKASHNLAYLLMLGGDLPRAIREMDTVAPSLAAESPASAAVYYVDRAQVMLAAALLHEADDDLARAVSLLADARRPQDRAEAELARARVALLDERWADAHRLAGQAHRRFARRGATGWALLAAHARVAAEAASAGRSAKLRGAGRGGRAAAAEAAELAALLEKAGLDDEARRARLTAVLASLRTSDGPDRAADLAGTALGLRRDDPIATRLQARTARAGLAQARGDGAAADRERRAALVDLHRYQASFGSLDLQTSVAGHGRRLADEGLAGALAGGRPATVFQWAQRARALSARLPPVLPPADPDAAALLEELRHARAEMRADGPVDPRLRARCTRLEQQIRRRSWYAPGPGTVTAPEPLSRLRDALAPHGGSFVAHLLSGGRLYALVATAGRAVVRPLGTAAPALEAQERLRHDLDALAIDALPAALRASVRASARSALRRLESLVWQPIRDAVSTGPVLLAPSAGLATVPWPLLPALRGVPVTVVASVSAWLAAREPAGGEAGDRVRLPATATVALAAGPAVARAPAEIAAVASVWASSPGSGTTGGGASRPGPASSTVVTTAGAVRAAAGDADLLHVAAHGRHEPDNPLLSHLDLADGPLFGYELERLARMPRHIVLSACELGLVRARPGDETLGMTAALLHAGAGSVVAGVARVGDAAAHRVAVAHHAGLRAGRAPAEALAGALAAMDAEEDQPALVCFGAGW